MMCFGFSVASKLARGLMTKLFALSLSVFLSFIPFGATANFDGLPSSLQRDLTESQVRNIAVELKYLDEVLTSSVLSYVFSGDEKWLDRYFEYEPRLTELINALLASQTDGDLDIVKELEAIHFELAIFEMQALDLVKADQRREAMDLINKEEYHFNKNQYMEVLLNLADRIEKRVKKSKKNRELSLTENELQWLDTKVIKVGIEHWPPMLYKNDNGQIAGLSGDIFNRIVQKTGLKVEPVEGEWGDLLNLFKKGEIDLIPHAYKNEQREAYGQFSTPYFLVRELFFVKDQDVQFKRAADLANATVAISAGYTTIDKVKDLYPNIKILETSGIDEAITAVLDGRADAVIDAEAVISNWLVQQQVSGLRSINEDILPPSALHLWSNNQNPILHSIVQKGLDSIDLRSLMLAKHDWYKTHNKSITDINSVSSNRVNFLDSLHYVIIAAALLLLCLMLIISRVFKASDNDLAKKLSSISFKRSVIVVQVILCVALLSTALIVTRYAERQSIETVNDSLSTVLASAHKRIVGWVDLELDSLGLLGQDQQLVALVEDLLEVDPTPTSLKSSPLQGQLRQLIEGRTSISGSFGYFIISPDKISLSSRRDSNIGSVNLIQSQHPELMEKVLSGQAIFIPPLKSDVILDTNDGEQAPPTMFFAVPIINTAGEVIAVLTKRVNFEGVFSTVLSAGFIGKSGETYAVDRAGLLLSNVRFEDQLKQIGLLDEQQRSSLNIRIADPGQNLIENPARADSSWPLTYMAEKISERVSGRNLVGYNDYRGVPVVGSWVWDEVLHLGIAAEMDVAEAYSLLYTFKITVWSILVVALVLMMGTSIFTLRIGTRATRALVNSRAELEVQVAQRTFELQINAERTQTIIDNASDGIIVVNSQGMIVEFSPAAEKIFGYSADEILTASIPIETLMSRSYHKDYQEFIVQGDLQSNLLLELVGYRKNGEEVDLEVAISEAIIAGEHLYTGIVRDTTERKEAERELMLAKQRAEEATSAKSDFLANMSHEIRTPMNAIIGMSYLAMQTELNKKQADYIGKIQTSAESLLGIINDILDFSKIEAGKLDLEQTEFDLEKSIDNLVHVVSQRTQEKGLELLVDLDPQLPPLLIGDPLRLGQILLNLTNNAIKFTDQGEIIVKAELFATRDDAVEVRFSIRDSGIGMTEEQISRLFQSFSQADASTTRKYGGTGLGLTISKTLVEMMNGSIWVESESGEGSTFYFSAQFGLSTNTSQTSLGAPESLDNLSVLIVDDSVAAREILFSLCQSLKFKADVASSGAEALDKIILAEKEKQPFDVILADWKMPEMDGVELGKQIALLQDFDKLPYFVMVTAYDRDEMMDHLQCVKVAASITKPVSSSTLLDTLLKVMSKKGGASKPLANNKLDISIVQGIAGASVLLVEDNVINQQIAIELLKLAGLDVTTASNGQEAVDRIAEQAFDLVLMDIQMPVMDGYQATRAIRDTGKHDQLPIIAMTANAMSGDRGKCIAAGMNDHLPKPINPNQVFQTLVDWIEPTGQSVSVIIEEDQESSFEIEDFDTQSAIARMGGNVKAYKKTLANVVQSEADVVQRVNAAIEKQDCNTAVIAVHSLKGIAGNIGANYLINPTERLEHSLLEHQFQSSAQSSAQAPPLVQLSDEQQDMLDEVGLLVEKMLAAITHVLEHSETQLWQSSPHSEQDREKFRELMILLYQQLDDFDSAAVDTFDDMLACMGTIFDKRLANKVATSISNYDFDAALPLLDQLTQGIELSSQAVDSQAVEKPKPVVTDLSELFEKMEHKIESFDSTVVDYLDEALEGNIEDWLKDRLQKLREPLSSYDFDKGAQMIEQLRQEMKV